jgi:NADPH:quinone reductase-like Zn-dependent oxidoreductase
MQPFVMNRYKGELAQREMPDPSPRPADVVVAIQATSVNPLDAKIRDGECKFILPYRLPRILGNDFAGTVLAVDAGARRFKVGDEVYARPDKDRSGTQTGRSQTVACHPLSRAKGKVIVDMRAESNQAENR